MLTCSLGILRRGRTCDEQTANDDEQHTHPFGPRYLFVEEDHSSNHAHNETHADHRISHTEWESLNNIHPQQGGHEETESTGGKLPIEEHARPESTVPSKGCHTHQGELQEDLPTRE